MSEWGKFILGIITIVFLIAVVIVCFREWVISTREKNKKGLYINTVLTTASLISLVYVIGGM